MWLQQIILWSWFFPRAARLESPSSGMRYTQLRRIVWLDDRNTLKWGKIARYKSTKTNSFVLEKNEWNKRGRILVVAQSFRREHHARRAVVPCLGVRCRFVVGNRRSGVNIRFCGYWMRMRNEYAHVECYGQHVTVSVPVCLPDRLMRQPKLVSSTWKCTSARNAWR